eukprot:TRINITY_DN4336_c0_g1_i1.p1 TRINITY_DN4336_c0_g1~~TRINITY_DN4336_c0_g1_i1.p1  ORF type:complete len:197 (-),score=50.71 TRINITY_DN4336_c0_g1_i1:71-661(-)
MTKENKYGHRTTAKEVASSFDLSGRNIIITGGNAGIGLEAAKVLAAQGAFIIIACRDPKKAEGAIAEIKADNEKAKVEAMSLNLSNLQSIRDFASSFNSRKIPLHVLMNNAGVMACPQNKTDDGFELQFGTNHLGHFLLTNLLIESLERGAPSRVINVSSRAHEMCSMQWGNLMWEKSYDNWKAYAKSKMRKLLSV